MLDGKIYVAGGFEGSTVVATVRVYDPAGDSWGVAPPLPAPRHHLALAAVDGDLYALGGMGPGGFSAVDDAYVLRAGAQSWAPIAALPAPRAAAVAGTIEGKIYLAGGQGEGGALLGPTLEYDPAADQWIERADLPERREHLAGFVYAGELWVLGGRANSLSSNTATVEVYDPAADSWRTGPRLNVAHGGFAAAVFGDVAVAVGGEQPDRALDEVETIRLPDGAWEPAGPVPTRRHGHAMAAVGGRFYVIGGADVPGLGAVATVESFSP